MKDGGGGRRRRRERKEEDPKEHSTRYDKYKADLNRLFDQGMAGELLKKMGKGAPGGGAKSKEADGRRKGNGRIPQNNTAAASRLRLHRAITEAVDQLSLVAAIDELAQKFGLPDDWEILVRVLEHPDEQLVLQALSKMRELLGTTARIPRRATLKERLRALSQTAAEHALRDLAANLEDQL